MRSSQLNLIIAWVWILLGFLSGLGLGLFFHREDWLGGYGSFRRRLYRLCHISFFGLGFVNLCFVLTVQHLNLPPPLFTTASLCFISGAVLMPICCLVMAHFPQSRLLFALPVISLVVAGALTVYGVTPPFQRNKATSVVGQQNQPSLLTAKH